MFRHAPPANQPIMAAAHGLHQEVRTSGVRGQGRSVPRLHREVQVTSQDRSTRWASLSSNQGDEEPPGQDKTMRLRDFPPETTSPGIKPVHGLHMIFGL